jgi:hypothetical protein
LLRKSSVAAAQTAEREQTQAKGLPRPKLDTSVSFGVEVFKVFPQPIWVAAAAVFEADAFSQGRVQVREGAD